VKPQAAKAPTRGTKCNNPPITASVPINFCCIMFRCSVVLMYPLKINVCIPALQICLMYNPLSVTHWANVAMSNDTAMWIARYNATCFIGS